MKSAGYDFKVIEDISIKKAADYYNNVSNEGHIFAFLQNEGNLDVVIKKGEHFVQGIIQKFMICDNEEVVTKTREGGFGSTDRKEE